MLTAYIKFYDRKKNKCLQRTNKKNLFFHFARSVKIKHYTIYIYKHAYSDDNT